MKKKLTWWLVFGVGAAPSVYLFTLYFFSPRALGIDPVETLLAETGNWALRFLLITLAWAHRCAGSALKCSVVSVECWVYILFITVVCTYLLM